MKRQLNPELDRLILDELARKYQLFEKRKGIHLSTLLYCLTRSYYDLKMPILPTDTEVMNFATGYGLQDILMPPDTSGLLLEKDGVAFRPDAVFAAGNLTVEVKSTRSGAKRYQEGKLPETWVEYMKGGCYIRGVNTYNLAVIYLAERPSAKLISETITFENIEIEENWGYILDRRNTYNKFIATNEIPTPFTYCKEWECRYGCRYKSVCDAVVMMNKRTQQAEKDIKELW